MITGAVANPGAALGGLLALGDEAVNAKLVALRSALALKWADRALGAMASAPTGYVLAATVEFWLHWLESLAGDLPGTARVFDQAARALAVQREAMIEPVVLRNRRPGAGGDAALEVPLAEFTRLDRAAAARSRAPGARLGGVRPGARRVARRERRPGHRPRIGQVSPAQRAHVTRPQSRR